MAIYGIGAFYGHDVSGYFINNNIIGVGWGAADAPELHQFMRTLKVGDIVYLKACFGGAEYITVKAIGIVKDSTVIGSGVFQNTEIARNVIWKDKTTFSIPRPGCKIHQNLSEKLNHRSNTIYEEFHEYVQSIILSKI